MCRSACATPLIPRFRIPKPLPHREDGSSPAMPLPPPPLHSQVLSIFRDHRKREAHPNLPHARVKKPKSFQHIVVNPSTRSLVSRLVCVSAPHGSQRLQLLKQGVIDRICSASHLATLVFGVDDAELMPPLCVVVRLLRAGLLRRGDVDHVLLLQRVEHEMNSSDVCLCRGAASGISSLLQYAVEVSLEQQQHDYLLQAFVSAVFSRTTHRLSLIHMRSRLLIAEKTILFITRHIESDDEGYDLLLEWVNQAVLPTVCSQQAITDVPSQSIWTPELSGLATGRSCAEYLLEGELYESVLRKLFAAIRPIDASDIYLACLNSFRQQIADKIRSSHLNGTWARFVLLGQRIADKDRYNDFNEDIFKKTLSSVSGALGALNATSDSYTSAVLICLARRLFIPFAKFPEGKQKSDVYQAYKNWFRQFVVQHGKIAVERIIHPLMQLLPLEPLELLRLNHRVFSSKRELARLLRDYLMEARSRISELDPKPRNFLSEEEASVRADVDEDIKNSPKLLQSCAHFVVEFARTKELPRSLLRQINFHRYHFQKTTKVALLDPLLYQYVTETGDVQFIAWKDKFEAHQINLIKHLAFKRKDKAISATEANTAIKSIHEARNATLCSVTRVGKSETIRQPTVDDSLQDILNGAIEAAIRLQHAKNDERNRSKESSPTKVLRMKLQKILPVESRDSLAKMVGELLHCLCLAIGEKFPERSIDENGTDQKPNILKDHENWWAITGKALRSVLLEVFGDPRIQTLQKPLQYQLFALICTKMEWLPTSIIRSTAMLTVTILTLQTESSLVDLCYFISNSNMSPILNVIIECLPFTNPTRVRNSVNYIFHCALLVYSASESSVEIMVESHDSTELLKTQGTLRSFQKVCKEKLKSLFVFLQWINCFPCRLFDARISKKEISHTRPQSQELSEFVNQVTKMLAFFGHQGFQDLQVDRIFDVELRCGWGRVDAVHSFLEQLECAGKCSKAILREAIHFLVTGEKRIASSREWIQNALIRFARDRTWCHRKVNGHNALDVSCMNYLCQEVKDCGAATGRDVFDLYILTDQCLFHGLSVHEGIRCIMNYLIPLFWPLPRRFVTFVVHKLNTKCISENHTDHGLVDIHLFTANIIAEVVYDKIHGALDSLLADLDTRVSCANISQQISEVTDAIQLLDRGNERNDEPSGFQRELIVSHVKKHSLCLGSAIVLSLHRNGDKQGHCTNLLRQRISLACQILPSLLVCEVLDSALGTAAILPFCFRFCTIREHKFKMRQTTEWIKVLTTERLALVDCDYTIPFHTRVELRGKTANKDPLVQTCLQWLGRLNEEKGEDPLRSSLPIAVCMGRVLGAFHSMDSQVLNSFITRVGKRMTRTLVSNTMFTYQSLSLDARRCADELPSESIQRLTEIRLKVQSDLLQAIGAILRTIRHISEPDFDECLTGILETYRDLEDEVRCALSMERQAS